MTPVMRSAAHRLQSSIGAVFEARGAWQVPSMYGSEQLETEAIRGGLGYADVSAQGKVHLSGSVEPWMTLLTGGSLAPLRAAPATKGGIVARLARDWAIVLVPPSGEGEMLATLESESADGAMATDVTSSMSAYMVAGPRLHDLVARTMTLDAAELRPGSCFVTTWAKIPAIVVAADIGVPAVELYVGSEYGRYAWLTLRDLCGWLGGSPTGWKALKSIGWRA